MDSQTFQNLKIKSRYLDKWQKRTLTLNPARHLLGISRHGGHLYKYFDLGSVKMQRKFTNEGRGQAKEEGILKIWVGRDRVYQVMGVGLGEFEEVVRGWQFLSKMGGLCQNNSISVPKKIDYSQYLQTHTVTSQKPSQQPNPKPEPQPRPRPHPREPSFLKLTDWALNPEEGGLILISPQKKQNQGKIIKFVLKKFITTGSFMGISFPVFAMKGQSILETYCKSFACAPVIFGAGGVGPLERLKQFVSFSFTFSQLFTDMDKPFNPTLGQTFQAEIGGYPFTAEQISHSPPQSALHLQGPGFTLTATLELVAQIGLNSATGMVQGDIIVSFDDGTRVTGRSLQGQMKGFMVGENRFRPGGACYAYEAGSKLVCSYKRAQKDVFRGYVGKLNQKAQQKFQKLLKTKQRFTEFESHSKSQFIEIESEMQASWSKYVRFDRKPHIEFSDKKWLPFRPTFQGLELLDSDSRHRKDISLRGLEKFQEAQEEKERIEEEERFFRKLRSNYGRKCKKQY